jgi:hypothetical protein
MSFSEKTSIERKVFHSGALEKVDILQQMSLNYAFLKNKSPYTSPFHNSIPSTTEVVQ